MGSRSKKYRRSIIKSSKTIKDWCRARGINPFDHIKQFPRFAGYYNISPPMPTTILKPSLWSKIKETICRMLRINRTTV